MEKKSFRRISLAVLSMGLIFGGSRFLSLYLSGYAVWNGTLAAWGGFLINLAVYGLGIVIPTWILRGLPVLPDPPKRKLTFGGFLGYFSASRGIAMVLAVVGVLVYAIVSALFHGPRGLTDYFLESGSGNAGSGIGMALEMVLICVAAPVAEELMFRKILLDPLRPFGDTAAILYSGIAFGLLHMTFQQMFFAAALGIILGYLAVKTGNIRVAVGLHFAVNASSAVLLPFLGRYFESLSDPARFGELVLMLLGVSGYAVLLILFGILGIVLFFVHLKKVRLDPPRFRFSVRVGAKLMLLNAGTIPYLLLCLFVPVYFIAVS